jgi:hypothetical protein
VSSPESAEPLTGGPIAVEPAALEVLAAELEALAAELARDAEHALSVAATFPVALGGEEGRAAGAAATAWASLEEVLADRTRALAGTLVGAAAAYRAEDAALSGHMGRGRPAGDRVPR